MRKAVVGFFILSISFLLVFFIMSGTAFPDESGACDSCHDTGDYTITADETVIETLKSKDFVITVTATGPDLVVEIPEGARDNDNFECSILLVEDNDDNDENSNDEEIEVEFTITAASKDGEFTLLIIAKEDGTGLIPLVELSIEVTVGEVEKTPFELFFDHTEYYIGGTALIFMFSGIILFQVKERKNSKSKESVLVKKKKFPKELNQDISEEKSIDFKNEIGSFNSSEKRIKVEPYGILIAIAFILITINIFLIMSDTIEFSFKSVGSIESRKLSDPDYVRDLNQFIHIILGSIGYIAGIIVLFGMFTDIQGKKLKFPLYIMTLGWVFNYLLAFFMNIRSIFF